MKRYSVYYDGIEYEDPNGKYVKYEDIQKLVRLIILASEQSGVEMCETLYKALEISQTIGE